MGIDQSLTGTGITIYKNGNYTFDMISTSKTKNTESPSIDYTLRLMKITNKIEELIINNNIDLVGIENMSFGSKGRTVFDLGGLSHLLRAMFIKNNINFIVVPPTVLKKFATGKGNAKKIDMINAVPQDINIPFKKKIDKVEMFDDNVVDSYFLARFAQLQETFTTVEYYFANRSADKLLSGVNDFINPGCNSIGQ
jgi:crossover junction endodeoxyribonuclease RuvC